MTADDYSGRVARWLRGDLTQEDPTDDNPASVPPEPPTLMSDTESAIARAWTELQRIIDGGSWRMAIPARPDRDSDLLIGEALRVAGALNTEVRALRAEVARWDECRRAVAESIGANPDTWPDHGNAPLAVASVVALRELQADSRAARSASGEDASHV